MSDWADREAREILKLAAEFNNLDGLPDLIASRLHVVHQSGVMDGIDKATNALTQAFDPTKLSATVKRITDSARPAEILELAEFDSMKH